MPTPTTPAAVLTGSNAFNAVPVDLDDMDALVEAPAAPEKGAPPTETETPPEKETPADTGETPADTGETPADTGETPPDGEGEESQVSGLDKAKDEEAQKAEKEKAEAEEARKKAEATPTVPDRDKDLTVPPESLAHMRPSTRKVIEEFKTKSIEARNAVDTLKKGAAEMEARLKAAEERASAVKPAKEVEEELTKLRETVRELDITRDPEIAKKYDAPAKANSERITAILKENEMPAEVLAKIQKVGYSMKTLAPSIDLLEKAGELDLAEELRDLVRQNARLNQGKVKEIEEWKTTYDSRTQERTAAQKQQQEKMFSAIQTGAQQVLAAEVEELAKTFSFLKRPAEVQPNDPPATAKLKQTALAEYEAAQKAVGEAAKEFNTAGKTPEELVKAQARFGASSALGLTFKHQILPRLTRDLVTKDARIKELEAELNKVRGAGKLSRAHATAAAATQTGEPLPAGIGEGLDAFVRQQGVDPNS